MISRKFIRRTGARFAFPFFPLVMAISALHMAPVSAQPISSTPSSNQNLTVAPTTVTLVFDQSIKQTGSDITVYDKNGQKASIGAATVDKTNLKKMTISMKGTNHQVYLVVWHTTSVANAESAVGAFSFGVNASQYPPSPISNSGTIQGSAQGSVLVASLVGVLGLALGATGGFVVGRRQSRAK